MAQPQKPLPAPQLDLTNIQGDILSGLPKKPETWYFFDIVDATDFRRHFRDFIPLVKPVSQVLKDRSDIEKHRRKHETNGTKPHLIPLVGVNVAFSHFGLEKLGIEHKNLVDTAFMTGQQIDAEASLGDNLTNWEPTFKNEIHGAIIVAGDSQVTVDKKIKEIEQIFGIGTSNPSIKEVTRVRGDTRPGDLSAHEHFGYLDGVSNPAVIGFDQKPNPGPDPIRAGAIILGHEGDGSKDQRDNWMVDGSFLVFRYLFQRVPEFDDFLDRNALKMPGLAHKEGADLLGARLVGRWKSGAPIDLAPFKNDAELANDPQRINNFSFAAEQNFQKLCPFASHIRKTLPRDDLEARGISLEKRRIMRRGIQFGPEVTKQEKRDKRTYHGRGLLFACYQSSITDGFQFIQQSWCNSPTFPFTENTPEVPGFDALIGQGPDRKLSGTDPNDPARELILPEEWVVAKGGEYFFSPSLKALKDIIASA